MFRTVLNRSALFCTVLHSCIIMNSLEDDEDSSIREVTAVSVPGGRSRLDVTLAKAGNWVLLEGVDASITRTATITDAEVSVCCYNCYSHVTL
jgi:hypothetical protein